MFRSILDFPAHHPELALVLQVALSFLAFLTSWLTSTRKITHNKSSGYHRPGLTAAEYIVLCVGIVFVLISACLAITNYLAQQEERRVQASQVAATTGKLDSMRRQLETAQSEIKTLDELRTPVRKITFRLVYGREPQKLRVRIEMWKKGVNFDVFRYKIRIGPSEIGTTSASQLAVKGDGAFSLSLKKGNVSGGFESAPPETVLCELPVQCRATDFLTYLETRIEADQNLAVNDLLGADVLLTFEEPGTRNISAEVVKELKQIQIYAPVGATKVVAFTYGVGDDPRLMKAATGKEQETLIEERDYMLHEWKSPSQPWLSGGLSIRHSSVTFAVATAKVTLEVLPEGF